MHNKDKNMNNRYTKEEKEILDRMAQELLTNLNRNTGQLNHAQRLELAALRLDAELNDTPQSEIKEWADNMTFLANKDGVWVDDGAHGYLIVRPGDKGYEKALTQLICTYNYHLSDGTILLEEDEEAGKFISYLNRK